ncbi:MAG: ribosome hibernation-promoting factor, HPF/YfiA family [Cyclobacteriaceae bacterium]
MKLQMHAVHFDADPKLIDFIQRKTDKLEAIYERIVDGEVFLKLENGEATDNKIVEIKINLPGNQLFAKEQNESFEAATDSAIDALKRQLKKYKEKQSAR